MSICNTLSGQWVERNDQSQSISSTYSFQELSVAFIPFALMNGSVTRHLWKKKLKKKVLQNEEPNFAELKLCSAVQLSEKAKACNGSLTSILTCTDSPCQEDTPLSFSFLLPPLYLSCSLLSLPFYPLSLSSPFFRSLSLTLSLLSLRFKKGLER